MQKNESNSAEESKRINELGKKVWKLLKPQRPMKSWFSNGTIILLWESGVAMETCGQICNNIWFFCCQDSRAELRVTQAGCSKLGVFGQTGLLVFSELIEVWRLFGLSHPCGRLLWRLQPPCVVSTEESLYEEALWVPFSFHAPPFFPKTFVLGFSFFSCFPQLVLYFLPACALFRSRTTGGASSPRCKTRIQDQSSTTLR